MQRPGGGRVLGGILEPEGAPVLQQHGGGGWRRMRRKKKSNQRPDWGGIGQHYKDLAFLPGKWAPLEDFEQRAGVSWHDFTGSLWLLLRMDFGRQKKGDHLGGLYSIQGEMGMIQTGVVRHGQILGLF